MAGIKEAHFFKEARSFSVTELGHTLVVAPHQDDESLGCGGTIALLRQAGYKVNVIFTSDGSMSHPASLKYATDQRISLREKEAVEALQVLGVDKSNIHFMRLKDSEVPGADEEGFLKAVDIFKQTLRSIEFSTILVPWRRDPHKDHRATWQIVITALANHAHPVRILEYFIWLWERSQPGDLPDDNEINIWQINISSVTAQKQQAIMAHQSQVTNLINDDPDGFILSPEVLAHFSDNLELFAEVLV